ncbi:uracil-DNA glycosylase [Chloroflexus sp.]|uniref:uracil-DNA glycosylase n=1 Tax=Chloroflexus sp. TaxID=1904827 RepID=UPI0029F6E72C|nr:uracil-DNA glycosylase [Chloroflexus sp.]MCS6886729.1 uracil-DNA glycosylase [Chloroflexus sp.]MCX7860616.1 uracil-DNA glycosylase [Chloroflexus sp.]
MESEVIAELIADLAALPAPPNTINMYAWDAADDEQRQGNAIRRANLALALQLAYQRGPDLVLIGEAPGYNGARRTGVPFTSEQILLDGIEPLGQFGTARGFQRATSDGRISREPTATIVYRELAALNRFAVGWNAFPLHPHQPGKPQSNRTPRSSELALGLPLLARACALFAGCPVVAMGRIASQALAQLGIVHTAVRHPAQGGARQFAEGLRYVCEQLGHRSGSKA